MDCRQFFRVSSHQRHIVNIVSVTRETVLTEQRQ